MNLNLYSIVLNSNMINNYIDDLIDIRIASSVQYMFYLNTVILLHCVHSTLFYFPSSSSTIRQTYTLKSIYHNNALGWTMQKYSILYS